jgi:hypothetical protein
MNGSPTLQDFTDSLDDLDDLIAGLHHHEEIRDHSLLLPDHNHDHAGEDDHLDDEDCVGTADHAAYGRDSPDSADRKAVQMELQDNTSLPTFSWTVDRSGSVPESALQPHKRDAATDFFEDNRHHSYGASSSLDPTPLSELHTTDHEFFFARSEPLPIPDNPSTGVILGDDVSNANAASALTTAATSPPPLPPDDASPTTPVKKKPVAAIKKKPSPTSRKPTTPPPKSTSAAGTGTAPSIQKASHQKAKYGFGQKHIVTAVPGHVAYERKKQRAKDARMRLNDSIDRLSLAMTIAGNTSQQRKCHWKLHDTAAALARCTEIATDAKKWDRPSFVGSAATMIQALNAQCDSLMKELHHAHAAAASQQQQQQKQQQQLSASKRRRLEDGSAAAVDDTTGATPPLGAPKDDNHHDDTDTTTTSTIAPPLLMWPDQFMSESRVLQRIGGFLGPRPLARNGRVCRAWKLWTRDAFIWEQLAIQRFGAMSVRQWNDKLDDSDGGSTNVYMAMDAHNVMPHITSLETASSLHMGQVRLAHRIGAWVYLRQRSNGETLQSVLNPLTGLYSSMPIVQLWIVLQNTGLDEIVIRDQPIVVDASTRRRGEELGEVTGPRFQKRWWRTDGTTEFTTSNNNNNSNGGVGSSRPLKLFDTIILEVNIHAHGCTTVAKFLQRSNYTKILFQQGDTTVPVIIPFPRDSLKT